jgi:hypothetical protein
MALFMDVHDIDANAVHRDAHGLVADAIRRNSPRSTGKPSSACIRHRGIQSRLAVVRPELGTSEMRSRRRAPST